jgi:anaerobic nitric oxide reductase transcription regulator
MQLRLGLGNVRVSPEALEVLSGYDWPGNVRELENILSRAVLKASASAAHEDATLIILRKEHLPNDLAGPSLPASGKYRQASAAPPVELPLREAVRLFQIERITMALEKNEHNWAAAARALGMHRSNLHNLATRLGLRR